MQSYLEKHPVIAILRGITESAVIDVAKILYEHGIRVIEVPLNKPSAFACISKIVNCLPNDCLVGAGTVTTVDQVKAIADLGAKLIISPHCDLKLIKYSQQLSMTVMPGVATPSEAISAYQAGAKWLKLFPATTYGIQHLAALKTVLPQDCHLIPVGGISAKNGQQWLTAGACALGIGNDLFREHDTPTTVKEKITRINHMLGMSV